MKKILLLLLIIGVISLSGCSGSSQQDNTGTEISSQPQIKNVNTETPKTENIEPKGGLITKSTDDMLPSGDDIPTEFQMGQIGNEDKDNMESSKILFSKIVGSSGTIDIDLKAYKYDSVENARIAYDKAVKIIKDERGYTELKSKVNAECFTYKIDYGFVAKFGENICINSDFRNTLFRHN